MLFVLQIYGNLLENKNIYLKLREEEMAKKATTTSNARAFIRKAKKKLGKHSKKKESKNKSSKNYKKPYRGQGKWEWGLYL